ncbi:hypothetical protein O181_042865 [Austropuccinia psidii MF-1]|uniref:Uncharacterized protein n=1 Tax=Austropuccinia psidii MF-1 TaxID=1389203 RepID=A0A9Q3DLF5_9BASI|nr:hypothetical protein [Austropuccinia psidii MF-1]
MDASNENLQIGREVEMSTHNAQFLMKHTLSLLSWLYKSIFSKAQRLYNTVKGTLIHKESKPRGIPAKWVLSNPTRRGAAKNPSK